MVAGWATVERISAVASISSPSRAVDGVVSRSTRTSSRSPSPTRRVSTWMPRDRGERRLGLAARRSCRCRRRCRTIRFWASSGKSAAASRSAAPMSVAALTGVDAIRSISRQVRRQALDERVLAERDDARESLGHHLERVAQEREGILAAGRADRIGQVDHEHGREPVDREHELEAGQRERRGTPGAASGRAAPTRRRPAPIRRRESEVRA